MKKLSLFLVMVLVIVSCAVTKNREKHKEAISFARYGKYDDAISAIKDEDFYSGEASALLKHLELGSLYYFKGAYYQALKHFDTAKALSDKLYTISISGRIKGIILNENLDDYSGEKYEVSMLRFYSALCHYHLYEQGYYEDYELKAKEDDEEIKVLKIEKKVLSNREKKRHLEAARSVIVEWASFLETTTNENLGNATYKDDLLNKIFGAMIHEIYGSRGDIEIARKLYIEAKDALLKSYSLYPTFNAKHQEFSDSFSKLHKLPIKVVKAKYIKETPSASSLKKFLDREARLISSKKSNNVKIVLKETLITEKTAEKIMFPLPRGSLDSEMSNFILSLVSGAIITFELPKIEQKPPAYPYDVKITNLKGEKLITGKLEVINPLSDIAYHGYNEGKAKLIAKVGTRVAAKHIAALIAAYAIYKSDEDGEGSDLSMILAMLFYHSAAQAIKASEQADIRYWGSLAGNVFASSFNLKPGEYKLTIIKNGKEVHTENIIADKTIKIVDINLM